jgi:hypothetical protein
MPYNIKNIPKHRLRTLLSRKRLLKWQTVNMADKSQNALNITLIFT